MADYKEMYLKIIRASEEAISKLVEAQKECEEIYINQPEPELKLIELPVQTEIEDFS